MSNSHNYEKGFSVFQNGTHTYVLFHENVYNLLGHALKCRVLEITSGADMDRAPLTASGHDSLYRLLIRNGGENP